MLFPIADPKTSGVESDSQMPYFTYTAICTNVYAMMTGTGAGIGHSWDTTSAPKLAAGHSDQFAMELWIGGHPHCRHVGRWMMHTLICLCII